MQLDGFLRFLDGSVEIALADFFRVLVADGVERNQLGEVVLVALFFLQGSVDIGQVAVVVDVVACRERMPPARLRCVLLRGTGSDE